MSDQGKEMREMLAKLDELARCSREVRRLAEQDLNDEGLDMVRDAYATLIKEYVKLQQYYGDEEGQR